MPDTPISLQVPRRCKRCGCIGRVHLQQVIQGERVILQWHCKACEDEWPVRRKEIPIAS